jgi:hypothetical protein
VFGRGDISEGGVQAAVVEPADVGGDRELELGWCSPDAVGDQLGLEAVDEALGERVDAPIVVKLLFLWSSVVYFWWGARRAPVVW